MTQSLRRALEEQKRSTQQETLRFTGILGIPLGGSRVVEVPTRKGYVYVRLRDNPNEVVQAFNNQVAPSYNLPVIIERISNKYIVSGVDTERYENNWNSYSPYLPRHGNTHSFDIESGGGGDIVWVYPRQFMPLLVFPSGSLGSPNVIVAPYTLKKDDNSWLYVGGTGTQSFASYRPSSPTGAVMGLVYLNTNDGNPYFIINSGSVFLNSITGSSQIYPYIPQITNPITQIPLAAIRLITGTNQISWDNIYDVRQFLHNSPSGTGGGSASINTGTLNSLYLRLDATNDPITGPLQIITPPSATADSSLEVVNKNTNKGGLFVNSVSGSWGSAIYARNEFVSYFSQYLAGNEILDFSMPVLWLDRFVADSSPNNASDAPAILIDDILGGVNYYGGTLHHRISGSVDILKLNPQATGSITPYVFDTQYAKPTGTILQSWRADRVERAYLDVSGTFHSNGSPLIKEAPVNSQIYGRKNAGWESLDGRYQPSGSISTANFITGSYTLLDGRYLPSGTVNVLTGRHFLPWGAYTHINPITADNSYPYSTTIDRSMTLIKWAQGVQILTTNDGSNYWTINIYRASDNALVNTINTSALTVGTASLLTDTSFAVSSLDASALFLYMHCTKVGAPGSLYIFGPQLEISL